MVGGREEWLQCHPHAQGHKRGTLRVAERVRVSSLGWPEYRPPLEELHHAKVMGRSRLLSRVPSLEGPGSQARYACRGGSPGIQRWMTRSETPLEELHHAHVMGSSRLRRPCAQSEGAALHGLARRLWPTRTSLSVCGPPSPRV